MTDNGLTPMPAAPKEIEAIEQRVNTIIGLRQRPLLVMYYPYRVPILPDQLEQLHLVLRGAGLTRKDRLDSLDVLLHTSGGDPATSYRLAQILRDFTSELTFLVAEYAYSGGTLMCLAGSEILLADYAVLSPIDITLEVPANDAGEDEHRYTEEDPDSEVETVAIDNFIQVAKEARIEIESAFRKRGWKLSKTDVENALLCEMTRQLGVLTIARYYREKNVTERYAEELLARCMLANVPTPNKGDLVHRILRRLVVESPSHEFPMDFHICRDIGLRVEEMEEELSGETKQLVRELDMAAQHLSAIVGRGRPYFEYYPTPSVEAAPADAGEPVAARPNGPTESTLGEEVSTDGHKIGESRPIV